jgi:hypothetical protein
MEIISGEGNANANRAWQFRIDQAGVGQKVNPTTGIGLAGAGRAAAITNLNTDFTKPRIEFANLHGIGSGTNANEAEAINLPTTGPNAVNNTDWYDIAVTYNGSPNTANNLSFYWTDLTEAANDSGVFQANLLGSTTMVNSLLATATPDFAIGNENRDSGSGTGEGESFVGSIDEVRIEGAALGADQLAVVPEPASLSLLAVGSGLVLMRRRKTSNED